MPNKFEVRCAIEIFISLKSVAECDQNATDPNTIQVIFGLGILDRLSKIVVERKRVFSAIFPEYVPTIPIVYRLVLREVRYHFKHRIMNIISSPEPMSESPYTEGVQTQERKYVPITSALCRG